MCQDLSVFQWEGSQSAPSFRVTRSQFLRQQLFKYLNALPSCGTSIVNPTNHQIRTYGCFSWVIVIKIRVSVEWIPAGGTRELWWGQRSVKGWCLPMFYERVSVASGCVVNLRSVPQAEAPGQVNRPFSQKDWGCVSVCCVCCALGAVACQELSFWLLQRVLWGSGTQSLLATKARRSMGVPCVNCVCRRLSRVSGRAQGWATRASFCRTSGERERAQGQGVPAGTIQGRGREQMLPASASIPIESPSRPLRCWQVIYDYQMNRLPV